MNTLVLKYEQHKKLIKNADVLLFHHPSFPKFGWWIGKYTHSPYSHVALAYWDNDELYALEFREFHGGRIYPVSKYLQQGYKIDVFRCFQNIEYDIAFYLSNLYVFKIKKQFDDIVKENIISTAKKLIGQPYSWWTIWQLAKNFIPFVRLRQKEPKNGEINPKQFVCSTLISYSYRTNFMDPVPFLYDFNTTPGDIARSRMFFKLFEIVSEKKVKKWR